MASVRNVDLYSPFEYEMNLYYKLKTSIPWFYFCSTLPIQVINEECAFTIQDPFDVSFTVDLDRGSSEVELLDFSSNLVASQDYKNGPCLGHYELVLSDGTLLTTSDFAYVKVATEPVLYVNPSTVFSKNG